MVNQGTLPLVDLKVHFPMAFMHVVLANAKKQGFIGSYQNSRIEEQKIRMSESKHADHSDAIIILHQGTAEVPEFQPIQKEMQAYEPAKALYCSGMITKTSQN